MKQLIEDVFDRKITISENELSELRNEILNKLNNGEIRAAENIDGKWEVNTWVKKGILLLLRDVPVVDYSIDDNFKFFDKSTLPLKNINLDSGIRLVPGGSSIRNGCYVAKGVICMPPMYINVGAYIDEGTMVDSHALVGTCAQIGKNVHLSAASQIGGVLEPAGAKPVIIEDNVMIGGNCGIYEGVRISKNAVIGTGVILNASTKVYDIVNGTIISSQNDIPIEIPENAVVVAGSRSIKGDFAEQNGLSIYTPLIIKYRDNKTNAKTALEMALR